MPRGREDEICRKALKLLVELCSEGTVENDRCLEFNYYLRDSGRPRPADAGKWEDGGEGHEWLPRTSSRPTRPLAARAPRFK